MGSFLFKSPHTSHWVKIFLRLNLVMHVKPENFLYFLSIHIGSSHSLFSLDFGCLLSDCYMSILPLPGQLHRVPLLNQTPHPSAVFLHISYRLPSWLDSVCTAPLPALARGAPWQALTGSYVCSEQSSGNVYGHCIACFQLFEVVTSGKKTNGWLDEI